MRYMYNTYHIIHIRMHTIPYILMYVPTTDNIRYDTICIPIYLYTLSLFLVASVASSKSYTSYSRHLFAFASRLSPLSPRSSSLTFLSLIHERFPDHTYLFWFLMVPIPYDTTYIHIIPYDCIYVTIHMYIHKYDTNSCSVLAMVPYTMRLSFCSSHKILPPSFYLWGEFDPLQAILSLTS